MGFSIDPYRIYQDLRDRRILSKYWIQFDVELNLFLLDKAIDIASFSYDKDGKTMTLQEERRHTHIAEIVCRFNNRGKVPFNLYNLQVWISTLKDGENQNERQKFFDGSTGRLRLKRLFTSGNLLDSDNDRKNAPITPEASDKYYYIGPQVEQAITFLTSIPEPREIVQVNGRFSLEQNRIFPEKVIGGKRLRPHTASKSYKISKEGFLINHSG